MRLLALVFLVLASCGPSNQEIVQMRGISNLCWNYLRLPPTDDFHQAVVSELKARQFDLKDCLTMDFDND